MVEFLDYPLQTGKEAMALLPVDILFEIAKLKTQVEARRKSLNGGQEFSSRIFKLPELQTGYFATD